MRGTDGAVTGTEGLVTGTEGLVTGTGPPFFFIFLQNPFQLHPFLSRLKLSGFSRMSKKGNSYRSWPNPNHCSLSPSPYLVTKGTRS